MAQTTSNPLTVVCYGDSNTWGYTPRTQQRYPRNKRWTGIMQEVLGDGFDVVEQGLNGRTTVQTDPCGSCYGHYDCNGRNYLPVALHSHKPIACLLLCLGANDLQSRFGGTPSSRVFRCSQGVECLVQSALDMWPHVGLFPANPCICVVGPPAMQRTAITEAWEFEDPLESTLQLDTIVAETCHRTCVGYVSMLDIDVCASQDDCQCDGVHYQEVVQRDIAFRLATTVQGLTATLPAQ